MAKGFLEAADRFQARGWAQDARAPGCHVDVEFILDKRSLGTATANIYRLDLARAGVGQGDHGFVFDFPMPLDDASAARVAAVALATDGTSVVLPRITPPQITNHAPMLQFDLPASDEAQQPVFILGAARSGTSAIAHALLKTESFHGFQEGQALDLLAHWAVRLHEFYRIKWNDRQPGRNTMISRIPPEYFDSGLNYLFLRAAQQLFGDGKWLDKTPNSDTIYLAPRFKQIWPHSRFIFMRRRALENLASRVRKFPHVSFARGCEEWKEAMEAWLHVRDDLVGHALELDQKYVASFPQAAAEQLGDFLDLSTLDTRIVAESLAHDRPERAAERPNDTLEMESLDWDDDRREAFGTICRAMMDAFGYTEDSSYHREGIAGGGIALR